MIAMTDTTARTPYDAEHIAIVDMGHTTWALYIPDPEQAKNPRAVAANITAPEYANVEVVATAIRCYKTEGATASGWFIRSGLDSGSEGYPNKQAMREALRLIISGYFGTTTEQETDTVTETAPRYVTHSFMAGTTTVFAVKDTVTKIDVASFYSREAARGKARRLNAAEIPAACPNHPAVADERGVHAEALPVPRCQDGPGYGVWDEGDGGFTYAVDCAMEAANWAAEQLNEDPDGEMTIKAVCREHREQPADSCMDCFADC